MQVSSVTPAVWPLQHIPVPRRASVLIVGGTLLAYLRTGNLLLAVGVHTLSNNVSPLIKEPFDGPGLGGGLIMLVTLLAVVFGPWAANRFGRRWLTRAQPRVAADDGRGIGF